MATEIHDELTTIYDTVVSEQRKKSQPFHLSVKVNVIDGKSILPIAYPHTCCKLYFNL